ncbi:tail completion protein gp17 [Janthinobacterium sp. GB4P2]|uniref:tail completion protein gp17 n=1 Tax=Janthinobacterium sp. GB4P2 TaxID=3424189 RepID=UPI003F23A4F5
MSAVKVVRALLLAHAPVLALVPAARIVVGTVPQGTPLPAIGLTEISRNELATVSLAQASVQVTARVQATVHANSYPEQKAVLQAAKLGPGAHTGIVAGIAVRSVMRDTVGPDLKSIGSDIFEQSRDFKVVFVEAN